jgi:hypothetical protein
MPACTLPDVFFFDVVSGIAIAVVVVYRTLNGMPR